MEDLNDLQGQSPRQNKERAAVDELLNLAFFVFHTSWIGFNCVGWIWQRTRRWHLLTVCLTAVSWFGLGYWYGWGYCPCTDWHWQVRARLGYHEPDSYMQLLIRELIGIELLPEHTDAFTGGVFAVVTLLSITLNLRDRGRAAAEFR